jgi:DNA replication and repair protein RecF
LHFTYLRLQHFRNYREATIELSEGVNCLVGDNGMGKTNLLEALYLLCTTRGFHADKELLMQGETYFMTEAEVQSDEDRLKVECNYQLGRNKVMRVNGVALRRMSDHLGRLPAICMLPEHTLLVREGGSERRKWLDSFLCQYSTGYLEQLQHYERCLTQRNAVLEAARDHAPMDAEQLALWTHQLIHYGLPIREARETFLVEFSPVFAQLYRSIAGDAEAPTLVYESNVPQNTEANWQEVMDSHLRRDSATGTTSVGIHRDDLAFGFEAENRANLSMKAFGSQGQQKTFVAALKFAQYQLLEQRTGQAPLLLLDDVFDKLDEQRMQHIFQLIQEKVRGQVVITDTSHTRLSRIFEVSGARDVRFFKVANGTVLPSTTK